MQAILNDTFDPVALSLPENEFIIEHGGKPPAVVARVALPAGVNARAVMPVIEQLYALDEVQKHDKVGWIGLLAIKERCQTYLDQHAGWQKLRAARGPQFPKYPTMAAWDSRGKPAMGASGSDAGHVRTYFDGNGDRQRFAVPLHGGPETQTDLLPWIKQTVQYTELIVNDTEGWLRCPVCQVTEKYQNDSQASRNSAQSRMAKHLLSAKEHIEAHRDLHLKVYGTVMLDPLYHNEPVPGVAGGSLRARDVGTVTTPIAKPKALGPETSWNYFHPGRVDVQFAPPEFRSQVHAIDPKLDVVWHPIHQRWTVWARNPQITHWICAGWQLLFPVRYPDGGYMPLDARTLATIYDRSPRKWGNGREYFDRIVSEIRRERASKLRERDHFVGQIARDQWKHAQIQVGYGASNGSKFSKHHAGG